MNMVVTKTDHDNRLAKAVAEWAYWGPGRSTMPGRSLVGTNHPWVLAGWLMSLLLGCSLLQRVLMGRLGPCLLHEAFCAHRLLVYVAELWAITFSFAWIISCCSCPCACLSPSCGKQGAADNCLHLRVLMGHGDLHVDLLSPSYVRETSCQVNSLSCT